MTNRNGIKKAAITSCIIFAVWLFFTFAAYVFQNDMLELFRTPADIMEETNCAVSWGAIVQCLFSIPIILSCCMIIKEKGGVLPLVISGIASVLMPVAASAASRVQQIFTGHLVGASELARIATVEIITSQLAHLLNAACLIAVAAAAVHFYASKNGDYKKEEV